MDHRHHNDVGRPPQFGGIGYVDPAKRRQQWLQERPRDDVIPIGGGLQEGTG